MNISDELIELKELIVEAIDNEDWECIENALNYINDMIADYNGKQDYKSDSNDDADETDNYN